MALDKLTKVQSVGISSFIQVVGVVTATGGFVGDVTGTTSNASGATGDFSIACLLYTSPSPRDQRGSRMPSSA